MSFPSSDCEGVQPVVWDQPSERRGGGFQQGGKVAGGPDGAAQVCERPRPPLHIAQPIQGREGRYGPRYVRGCPEYDLVPGPVECVGGIRANAQRSDGLPAICQRDAHEGTQSRLRVGPQ